MILRQVEIVVASAPALLHEVQLAQASIHVTCVCTYIDTMYISNLYMYQKSFEVPTMRSHARKRKYLFGTSGDACVIFREVWEMNITFCFKSTFCHQILSWFEHCFVWHVIHVDCLRKLYQHSVCLMIWVTTRNCETKLQVRDVMTTGISTGTATGESYVFTVTITCLSMRWFKSGLYR